MSYSLRIHIGNDIALKTEAIQAIKEEGKEAGIKIQSSPLYTRGVPPYSDIIVLLSSAGAFTALYQIIFRLIDKDKNREITIERKGIKISLKGHSLPETIRLLEQLTPELIEHKTFKRMK